MSVNSNSNESVVYQSNVSVVLSIETMKDTARSRAIAPCT